MIIDNFVLIIGLIAIGSLMKKSDWFPANTNDVLNKIVLNISLPAIILLNIPKLIINSEVYYPVLIHWVSFVTHIIILVALWKVLKFKKSTFGALLIVSTLGNTAFLGIPMVKSLYGDAAVPFAVLYDQLGSGIGFILYGAFVLPWVTGGKLHSWKEVFKKLLTFPPFLALIGGFLLMSVQLPTAATGLLNSLAATLIPCAMIAVGFQMKYRLPHTILWPVALGLSIKLLMIPLLMIYGAKFFGMNSLAANVAVLQSGMPPMITAGAMAITAKLEEDLVTALVGYGLIISFLTIPFLKYLS